MRRPAVFFLALAAACISLHAQTSCPTSTVRGSWAYVVNDCGSRLCSPATDVTLTIVPIPGFCSPPTPTCPPAYNLQACDTVRWRFGDGSPDEIRVGQTSILHRFSGLGVQTPTAVITNALSRDEKAPETQVAGESIYIVDDPPARVAFSRTQYDVAENGGSVTITLTRGGNLSRPSLVHYSNFGPGILPPIRIDRLQVVNGSVTFDAGETTKSFTVAVYDDAKYSGDQFMSIRIFGDDGTLFAQKDHADAMIHVVEDDELITLKASPGLLTLHSGESGIVIFTLSPARNVPVQVTLSATESGFIEFPSTITIPAGGSATISVRALRLGLGVIQATSSEANAAVAVEVLGRPRRRTAGS